MESCEEADAFDDLNSRQKRSVYAKAAKMSQQQEIQFDEPATPSAMDDWGTFIPQVQQMRRPEQRNVVELSFSPDTPPPTNSIIEHSPSVSAAVDDKFAQLSAIPEFRNFIEAGREVNLPVMDIIKVYTHAPTHKTRQLDSDQSLATIHRPICHNLYQI